MLERDIHYGKPTVDLAMISFERSLKEAKQKKEQVLKLVVGYGSTGGTHRIKSRVLEELGLKKQKREIKDFICGNDLDIFSSIYHDFSYGYLIPDDEKRIMNKGAIFIIL